MKRKLRWFLILLILGAFAVWLEPTRVPWGWLCGEAFYDGRPTSWWKAELARWDMLQRGLRRDDPERIAAFFERKKLNAFDWLRAWFGKDDVINVNQMALLDTDGPTLLRGDPEAEPMLRALIEHRDPHVRQLAIYGLQRVEATWRKKGDARHGEAPIAN